MNETIKTIMTRRSIRKFKDMQIPQDDLEVIIEAGLHAPSGHNQQSWNFTVIQDRSLLEEISRASKRSALDFPDETIQRMARNERFDIFYGAPTVIIISGRDTAMTPQADCGAATQNMLLAAESLGYGGCWNGFVGFLFQGEQAVHFRDTLQIPEGNTAYYAIALGYKAMNPTEAPERRKGTVQFII